MAAELGTAYISVSLSTANLAGQVKKSFAGVDQVGSNVGKTAGANVGSGLKVGLGTVAGLAGGVLAAVGFDKYIGEAITASDSTNKFKSSLNFAGLSTKEVDAATAAAKNYADQTVYDLPTVQNTIAQLAANGVKDYTGLTTAAGNLNAVAGGSAESFKSVSMVLSQTNSAGKLTAENWNQLSDAIPGGSGKLQEALKKNGAFTGNFRDAMSKGQITADEFNKALLQVGNQPVAVEAAKSTSTFEGAMGNLSATINTQLVTALDRIKPFITDLMTNLGSFASVAIPAVTSAIGDVVGGVMGAVNWLGQFDGLLPAIGAALGTVVVGIVAVRIATATWAAVQAVMNGVLLANPIGLVIAGLALLVGAVVLVALNWGKVVSFVTGVWGGFTGWLRGSLGAIGSFFTSIWGNITSFVSGAIRTVSAVVTGTIRGISGVWNGVWGSVGSFLSSTWSGIISSVSSGVGSVIRFLGSLPGKIMGIFAGAGGWLVSIGQNIVQGLISGIGSMMGAIGRAILNIVPEAIRGPFEAALGIHSPSRVFKGYGINIGQGLINGTEKMMPKIKSTMQGLVELPAVPTVSAAAFRTGSNAAAMAPAYGSMQQVINFDMQPMEPEATASAVARRLNMMVA